MREVPLAAKESVIIKAGTSLSDSLDCCCWTLVGVGLPLGWQTRRLTFQVSPDNQTFFELRNADGVVQTPNMAAGDAVSLSSSDFFGWRYVRIRSGTGNGNNQNADRILTCVLRAI